MIAGHQDRQGFARFGHRDAHLPIVRNGACSERTYNRQAEHHSDDHAPRFAYRGILLHAIILPADRAQSPQNGAPAHRSLAHRCPDSRPLSGLRSGTRLPPPSGKGWRSSCFLANLEQEYGAAWDEWAGTENRGCGTPRRVTG